MRNRSLLLRGCASIILLAHLMIFVSFFFPYYSQRPGEPPYLGWQVACGCSITPSSLQLIVPSLVVTAFVEFIVLALPPLAAWVASRFPVRMIGLLGVWLSLPLILAFFLVYAAFGLGPGWLSRATPLIWIPPLGLALSFTLCLVLAILLPLIRAHERAALLVSRPERPTSAQDESTERFHIPASEMRTEHTSIDLRLLGLAFLGLLCHLIIFLSLFFTYTEIYNPYDIENPITRTTGWQMIGSGFQPQTYYLPIPSIPAVVAILLLAVLILPALIYLACLLLIPFKSAKIGTLLFKSIYLSYLLNIIGFSLSSIGLVFSLLFRGGDLHNPVQSTDAAFVVPPVAFLLSLLCSRVLIGSGLRPRPR
jgi:MFS family permease